MGQFTASFERLTGAELGHLGRLDLDRVAGAGLRPARAARLVTLNVPKPTKETLPFFFSVVLTPPNQRFQSTASRCLGDVGLLGNVLDQFGLVHVNTLKSWPVTQSSHINVRDLSARSSSRGGSGFYAHSAGH